MHTSGFFFYNYMLRKIINN